MWAEASPLLRLDVRRPDHLAPLLGFFGNERPEIARRATEDNAAQVGELSLQLGIGEARIDLLVELVDDLGRRLCRCAEAEIAARLVARHKFGPVGTSGSASERVIVHTASARSLPALMYSIEAGRNR